MTDPVLDPLNEQQEKAVQHVEGPLLILAGAGSGKTRVITHRMAYLIRDQNVAPYKILGVTFTNKAADEMIERTRELVGRQNLQPELSTFHSFGVEFLRSEAEALDRSRNFTIYDSGDQRSMVKECMEELGVDPDRLKPKKVVNRIGRAKDQMIAPEDYEIEMDNPDSRIFNIYERYQEKLRDNNAYDFGDLIVEPVYLLKRNEMVRERWTSGSRSFEYIMIDEFQDTNPAQYELAEILSEVNRNIAVVGDDDQSIYSWRGADVTNILNFESDFPETKTIRLERNYRSTQPILEAAHNVISHNTSRKDKELWTAEEEGKEPTVHEAQSDYDEAEYVLDTIQLLEKMRNISPGDCAIFFRTNAQTRVFEEVFMREGMPYVIVSGVGFYERKEIKDLMAYLNVLVNPDDDQSLRRIINTPTRGIGNKTLETLEEVADEEGTGLVEALSTIEDREEIGGRAASSLGSFRELYEELRELKNDKTPLEVLEKVIDKTRYIEDEVEKEDEETAESRKENIEELKRVADTFTHERPDPTLEEFVEEVSLLSDVDTFEENQNRVNMMTLHAAKGLEFPVVFMVGMEEGLLPHSNSEYDQERLEEERRLCYVGFTRAQERLYCTWSRKRWMYGSERSNRPSRFLDEAELMKDEKQETEPDPFQSPDTVSEDRTVEASIESQAKEEKQSLLQDLSPGDTVKHPKFGEGRLEEISGSESSPIAKIDFKSVGIKRLAVTFARLEKVS